MTKHLIDFDNLSFKELQNIIDYAMSLKKEHNEGIINDSLKNKTLAMIFDKSSTRTRVSFETGMTQLGGHALFLSNKDIQLGRGEPIIDSAIVISSMVDAVTLRISSHEDIIEFSKHSNKPVINALSDLSHPCQLLADLMTFQEHRGSIKGKKVAWIGDGNNVCQTYMQASEIFGFELTIATPNGYEPNQSFVENYQKNVDYCTNPMNACEAADLVVTDVWASMGKESEQNSENQLLRVIRSAKK